MNITPTRNGFRLSQHGVVLSELRTSPGPTHSVFDVLAALIAVLKPRGRIGVLGFAGGGMMAPMRHLGIESTMDTVDLDRTGYDLFCRHCPEWVGRVNWQQADAAVWLRNQPADFALLMDDLSVPSGRDVIKPAITWDVLPDLIRQRLQSGGSAAFNLLSPPTGWSRELGKLAGDFKCARVIHLVEFENRILVIGRDLPSARALGVQLRQALRQLGSRQAGKIHCRHFAARSGAEGKTAFGHDIWPASRQ